MHTNQKYCRYLRGKNAFGSLEGGEHPFQFYDNSLTTYWCICSMTALGPDGGLVHITTCGDTRRACFREVKKEEMEE